MLMSNGLSHSFNYRYFRYNLNRACAVYIKLIPQHNYVFIILPLTMKQWTGTAIGVTSVIFFSSDSLALGYAPLLACFIQVASMLLFAMITVLQKKLKSIATPIHQSPAIQCVTASCFFVPWAWYDGPILPPKTMNFLICIACLVIFATYVCYAFYYVLLRQRPPARVSTVVYLSPPMTII